MNEYTHMGNCTNTLQVCVMVPEALWWISLDAVWVLQGNCLLPRLYLQRQEYLRDRAAGNS